MEKNRYKIFVISLKENNSERRSNIESQFFGKYNFEWIDAIKGNELKDKSPHLTQDAMWLRDGQIGCALSHIEAYRRIENDNLSWALIFEDDVKIVGEIDFKKIDDFFIKKNDSSSVLFLNSNTFPKEVIQMKRTDISNFYSLQEGRPLLAVAYVINRKAAHIMLNKAFPILTVADDWDRFKTYGFVDEYYFQFPFPAKTQDFDSQIGYQHYGRKQKWKYKLSRLPIIVKIFKLLTTNDSQKSFKIL